MTNRNLVIVFSVILGFILLPVFMWISEHVFKLFMPNGQNFVFYKFTIGLLYAAYIFFIRKVISKISKENTEAKSNE